LTLPIGDLRPHPDVSMNVQMNPWLFTRSARAENPCQAGNYGLAPRTIPTWRDELILPKRAGSNINASRP
jgi:hypothetical protein